MAFDAKKNFAYGVVSTAPSPATSGTSVTLQAGHGARFPAPPFNAVVWPEKSGALGSNAEVVRVIGSAGDVLTITRGQESSAARTIVIGDQFALNITTKAMTDMETAITGITPKEEALEGSGTIKLDLSKATVFKVKLIGNAEFEFINAPTRPLEASIIVTQDVVGKRKWKIKGILWVGSGGEPTFTEVPNEKSIASVTILENGGMILGFSGGGEAELAWTPVESLNAKIKAFGAPYSTELRCALAKNGIVHLSGLIKVEVACPIATILFKLPVAMRPATQQAINIGDAGKTNAAYVLLVKTTGDVELAIEELKVTYVPTLAGASFPVK